MLIVSVGKAWLSAGEELNSSPVALWRPARFSRYKLSEVKAPFIRHTMLAQTQLLILSNEMFCFPVYIQSITEAGPRE